MKHFVIQKNHNNGRPGFLTLVRNNKELLLLALPGVLVTLIYYYAPMIGIVIAFQDYKFDKGLLFSKFIGFKNFEFFFNQYAGRIIGNTLFLNIAFIISTLILSVFVAIILNDLKNRLYVKFAQTCMFLPYFISWVIVGYFAITLFDEKFGIINQVMSGFGINQVSWYAEPGYWPAILILFNLWKQLGLNSVIYLAAITNISSDIYEASDIDGANKIQKVFYITLPGISPIIWVMLLMSVGQIFRSDFGLFYNITRDFGSLYSKTDVIDTYVVRSLRVIGDIGMASAAGFIQSIVGLLMVTVFNMVIRKINDENALF